MAEKSFNNSLGRIKTSARLLIVLSVINLVLDIVFILLHFGQIAISSEIIYMVCIVLIIIASIIFGFIFDKLFAGLIKED